ncbi:MAG: tryptophan synthase subunit alpha [Thaumarchaeota archaeon]|nr:tryptophan synthase subunit alpha [Nitrososphaerota archaeon]
MTNGVAMIEDAFSSAREEGARVLIGFLASGDPSAKHSLRLAESLIRGGVDIIELCIAFSDPVADGPSIQAANARALGANTTPQTTLRIVRDRSLPSALAKELMRKLREQSVNKGWKLY